MGSDLADLVVAALRSRGTATLTVRGESMLPTLRPGDVVRIDRTPLADVRPGHVVAARFGEHVFVHRVLARDGDVTHTAGDNMELFDPPVTAADLLGVVRDVPATLPRRAVPRPAGPVGPGHLWVLRAVPDDVRARVEALGWHVHVRTGPVDATLAELRERAAGRFRVGVSEYGVHDAREVLGGGLLAGSHVVLGRFGGAPMLSPGAVDTHVRLSRPGHDLGLRAAVDRLADAVLRMPAGAVS